MEYCIRLYIYTLHSTVHNKDHNIHNNTLQHFLLELILPAELILPLELILFHYEIQISIHSIRGFKTPWPALTLSSLSDPNTYLPTLLGDIKHFDPP